MGADKVYSKGAGRTVARDIELTPRSKTLGLLEEVCEFIFERSQAILHFTERITKGFVLSAKRIDFFRELGKAVGVGRWVGIRKGGTIHTCTRFFGRWTGGMLELSF